LKRCFNLCEYLGEVALDMLGCHPHKTEPHRLQNPLALSVVLLSVIVGGTIDLNGHHLFETTDVDHELAYRMLAPELVPP
jgi:hypothetical protein